MSTLVITRHLLGCDGCNAIFGGPEGFTNITEARAAAYADGWRFPNQIGKTGAIVRTTSDVCPTCVPGWKPQPRASRMRALTKAEAEAL